MAPDPDNSFSKAYCCYWQLISVGLICVLILSSPAVVVLAKRTAGGVSLPVDDREKVDEAIILAEEDGLPAAPLPDLELARRSKPTALLSGGSTTTAAGDQQGECRRPLLEIIDLTIDNAKELNRLMRLFGNVVVTDVKGLQYMYQKDLPLPAKWGVLRGKPVPLEGPSRPISAKGTVTLGFDLTDEASDHSITPVLWSSEEIWGDGVADKPAEYGKPYTRKIYSSDSNATLRYMVLCDAVGAKIDAIKLVRGNDGGQDQVYGHIGAQVGVTGAEIMVFNRSRGWTVEYNQPIPLLRTLVAVPTTSSGYVRFSVRLYDEDKSSADDEIITGSATFRPKDSGTAEMQRISAETGEIAIIITWITG